VSAPIASRHRRVCPMNQPSTSRSTSAVFSRMSGSLPRRLDIQAHQGLSVRASQVKAPDIELHRQPVGEIDGLRFALVAGAHPRENALASVVRCRLISPARRVEPHCAPPRAPRAACHARDHRQHQEPRNHAAVAVGEFCGSSDARSSRHHTPRQPRRIFCLMNACPDLHCTAVPP